MNTLNSLENLVRQTKNCCGNPIEYNNVGIFTCPTCGKVHKDAMKVIRLYLEKNGATPAMVVAKDTGLPMRDVIKYMQKHEF